MNKFKRFVLTLLSAIYCLSAAVKAQEVSVNVLSASPVLPPQAGLYVDDPGRFFTVTLTNMGESPVQVFLGISLEQQLPGTLTLHTPTNMPPAHPLTLTPNVPYTVTRAEMRELFKQVDLSSIVMTGGNLNDFTSGVVGLLPEGHYLGQILVYRWSLAGGTPQLLSNPMIGQCPFDICYNAAAPVITRPSDVLMPSVFDDVIAGDAALYNAATIDFSQPVIFQWEPVTQTCARTMPQVTYELEFFQMADGQTPDDAVRYAISVFHQRNIHTSQYVVTSPLSALKTQFIEGKYYVMRVRATTTATDSGRSDFMQIENDGYSPLRVIKASYGGKGDGDLKEKDEEKEDDKKDKPEEEKKDTVAWYSVPELTTPNSERGIWTANRIIPQDSIVMAWKEPAFQKGLLGLKPKFTYTIGVYPIDPGDVIIDSILVKTPVFKRDTIMSIGKDSLLRDTIRWSDIEKKVKIGEEYMLIVSAKDKALKDSLKFLPGGSNCYPLTYYDDSWKDKQAACDPEALKQIENKTSVEIPSEELTDGKKKKVKIGRFDLYLTKAEKTTKPESTKGEKGGGKKEGKAGDKKSEEIGYKGEGYVVWRPYGKDLEFAVTFDWLSVNSDNQVIDGEVHSATHDSKTSEYAGMFNKLGDIIDNSLDTQLGGSIASQYPEGEAALKKQLGDYYKYVHGSGGYGNAAYNLLMSGFDAAPDSPMKLPLGMPEEMVPDLPLDISMTHMTFSPTTAYLSLICMFKLPGSDPEEVDDQVLAFGCPRLCITPESAWAETGTFGLLYDLKVKDPDSKFVFSFKAPKDWSKLNEGTFVSWKDNEFDCLGIQCSATVPDLLKDDGAGNTNGSTAPEISFGAVISDWDNWIAYAGMDPFQIKQAPGFTFVPGSNIVYDHAIRKNADGFALPKDYVLRTSGFATGLSWQGLYIDRMQMKFPTILSFSEEEKSDGDAGKKGDAPKAKKGEDGRLALSFDNFLLDVAPKGIFSSFEVSVNNVFKAETCRAGGWGISMDKIYFSLLQNNFHDSGFTGTLKVPLLNGTIDYRCAIEPTYISMGEQNKQTDLQMIFETQQAKDLSLDFWLGDAEFLKEGTYFRLTHKFESDYQEADTDIELIASGKISILSEKAKDGSRKPRLGFNLPGIKFAGMRLANKKYERMHGAQDWQKKNPLNGITSFDRDYANDYIGTSLSKAMENMDKSKSDTGKGGGAGSASFTKLAGSDTANDLDRTIIEKEHEIVEDALYFSLGSWSLASPEKGLWGLPIVLKKPEIKTDKEEGGLRLGLGLCGGLSIFGEKPAEEEMQANGASAVAALTIWADIKNVNLSNISDIDIDYQETTFDSIHVAGVFGGGALTVEGRLEVIDDEGEEKSKEGFNAAIELNVKNLFKMRTTGAYYKVNEKIEGEDTEYRAGYMLGSVSSKAGIPIGPVTLNNIYGGFLINMGLPVGTDLAKGDLTDLKPVERYKSYGGAFGLGMTVGEETLIKGRMSMLVIYDAQIDKLSNFHLTGDIDALNVADSQEKGLVHARADILYEDTRTASTMKDPEVVQKFTLNITVDSGADMADLYKQFTGMEYSLPEAVTAGLDEFSSDKADDQGDDNGVKSATSEDGARTQSDAEKRAEKNGYISGSVGAHIGMEFQFRYYPNKSGKEQKKWHLYVGKPTPETERCRITFLDFALGKDQPVGLWAKVYANAYLCLGNELPNGAALPELPDKVLDALGGIGADGKSHGSEYMQKIEKERARLIKEGPAGRIEGGVQFGAALGAEIGCNAVFCYASVEAMLGLDVILEKFGDDCNCTDGSALGGKNGYYAQGQLYAMMKGEMGLMVDLWIFSGKIPLVTMSVGALLKGGLPNPTWAYGKLRAKGEVLKGLVKFNSSIEMKMGRICVPSGGNPLDDIKIFGDYSMGSEKLAEAVKEGMEVSPDANFSFTTNMGIGTRIELIDEAKIAKEASLSDDLEKYKADAVRVYRFMLDPEMTFEQVTGDDEENLATVGRSYRLKPNATTADKENFELYLGALDSEKVYRLKLRGYAEEYRGGKWQDPYFEDSKTHKQIQKDWHQGLTLFFKTGKLSNNVMDNVMWTIPFADKESTHSGAPAFIGFEAPRNEAARPQFILNRSRADLWNSDEYEYYGQLHYLDETFGGHSIERIVRKEAYLDRLYYLVRNSEGNTVDVQDINEAYWRLPDLTYSRSEGDSHVPRRRDGQVSEYENIPMMELVEESGQYNYKYATFMPVAPLQHSFTNHFYRFRVVRLRKAEMQNYLDEIEEKFVSLMQTSGGEVVTLQNTQEGTEADPTSTMAQEMLQYYKDLSAELGPDEAEQRMMSYRQQVREKSRSKFSDEICAQYYTVGSTASFAQWLKQMSASYSNSDIHAAYMPEYIQTQLSEIVSSRTSVTSFNDPAQAILWWNKAMASGRSSTGLFSWRLRRDKISFPQRLQVTLRNPVNSNRIEYNLRPSVGTYVVGSDLPAKMSLIHENKWMKGFGNLALYTNLYKQIIVSDALLAAELENGLSSTWYSINGNSTYATLRGLNSIDSRFDKIRSWTDNVGTASYTNYGLPIYEGQRTYLSTSAWPKYQLAYIYGTEDRGKEYSQKSDWGRMSDFGHYPTGAIYRLDRIHNQLKTSATYSLSVRMPRTAVLDEMELGSWSETYYNNNFSWMKDRVAPKDYRFTVGMFDYTAYINSISALKYRVRRLTGYNYATGAAEQKGLRPSTIGEYQAMVSVSVKMDGSTKGSTGGSVSAASVSVQMADTVFIPDPGFREWIFIEHNFDTNGDGYLQRSEAQSAEWLNIDMDRHPDHKPILDFTGLESLTGLDQIDIKGGKTTGNTGYGITQINLSNLQKLTKVTITDLYNLERLNISNCPELTRLTVTNTRWNSGRVSDRRGIKELDVRGCVNLQQLKCQDNLISSLDVSQSPNLTVLMCDGNMLTQLHLEDNPLLNYTLSSLHVGRQYYQSSTSGLGTWRCSRCLELYSAMHVSGETLKSLGFQPASTYSTKSSPAATEYNANVLYRMLNASIFSAKKSEMDPILYDYLIKKYSTNNKVSTLDFEKMYNETSLDISDLSIASLKHLEIWMPKLQKLFCNNNQLTEIDLSGFLKLNELRCQNNQIFRITSTRNTTLKKLWCWNNQLAGFNGEIHPLLEEISAGDNPLTMLMLAKNTRLKVVKCARTSLEVLNLKASQTTLVTVDISDIPTLRQCSFDWANTTSLRNLNLANTMASVGCVNTVNANLENVDITNSNCSFDLTKNMPGLQTLRLSGSKTTSGTGSLTINTTRYPELERFDYRGTPLTSLTIVQDVKSLRYVDVSHGGIRTVYQYAASVDTLKMGVPANPVYSDGMAVRPKLIGSSVGLRHWPDWSRDKDNSQIYCSSEPMGSKTFNPLDSEENIKRLKDAVGSVLYQRLREKYAVAQEDFLPSMAQQLDSLDCSASGQHSLEFLTWFPNLKWINASHNYIRRIDALSGMSTSIKYLDLSDNEEFTSYDILLGISGEGSVVNLSATGINESQLKDIIYTGVQTVIARDCAKLPNRVSIECSTLKFLDVTGGQLKTPSIPSRLTRVTSPTKLLSL